MTHDPHELAPPEAPTRTIRLEVDGAQRTVLVEDRELLVDVLRDRVGAKAPKVGCYSGDCGACTVEVNGKVTKSCLVLAATVDGGTVTTLSGVADSTDELDPIQRAFWEADAFQCGFCLSGFVFSARELLGRVDDPSEEEIRTALIGNYCRCTGYSRFVEAIQTAAARRRGDAG
jgi:aerobic-type carbon monoxide dehydrogenase small subunit (CoxS/CutS family)